MRAVVYDHYGGPEDLEVRDVPMPRPAARQVRVRVMATSVNLSDWECLLGRPIYARIGGLRRPARSVLGSDIAGFVDAVGEDVHEFRVGDEVYGDNLALKGGFAQYAVAPVTALALKPQELTFAQASAIPQSGAIALQGMARVRAGARVLVNGGGGGSGAFAIQLARRAGAHVTAVDNAAKLGFMQALGAHETIDYRERDFTDGGPYDVVLDLVAHRSPLAYQRALARGGRYRCVGGGIPSLLGVLVGGAALGAATGRSIGVLAVKQGPEHFTPLARMCARQEIQVHVAQTFPLEETAAALTRVGQGAALGKVVVTPTSRHDLQTGATSLR